MILPHDPFGQVMLTNLAQRGVALSSIHAYPTLEAQRERFRLLGYPQTEALSLSQVYSRLLPPEDTRRIQRLEIFDEFEEWNLLQAHYCLVLACHDTGAESEGDEGQVASRPASMWSHLTLTRNR